MPDTSDRVGFRLPLGSDQVSRQLDIYDNLKLANDKYPNEIVADSATKPSTGLFNGKLIFETDRGVHLVRRTTVNRWWPVNGILLGRGFNKGFSTNITSTGPTPGTDVDSDSFSFNIPGGFDHASLEAGSWIITIYTQIYLVHAVRGFCNFRIKRIGIGVAVNSQEGDMEIPARIEATNNQAFTVMSTFRREDLTAGYDPADPWAVKMGFWLASAGTNVFKGASFHAWLSPVENVWS